MNKEEKELLDCAKEVVNTIEYGECFVDKDELKFLLHGISKMYDMVCSMYAHFND